MFYRWITAATVAACVLLGGCASAPPIADTAARSELAPGGVLRAAFLGGNPVQAARDPATGEYRGVVIDLARELAQSIGAKLELKPMRNVGHVLETIRSTEWDVAFIAYDPARAKELDFAPAYMEGHNSLLVYRESPLRNAADIDLPGLRISLQKGDAVDLHLTRVLKHATLVRLDQPGAFAALMQKNVDAYAGNIERHTQLAGQHPQLRVLPGSVLGVQQAVALPAGRSAGLRHLTAFVEHAKRSGFIDQAIRRAGIHGANVMP